MIFSHLKARGDTHPDRRISRSRLRVTPRPHRHDRAQQRTLTIRAA
jgi:hypothetical protein